MNYLNISKVVSLFVPILFINTYAATPINASNSRIAEMFEEAKQETTKKASSFDEKEVYPYLSEKIKYNFGISAGEIFYYSYSSPFAGGKTNFPRIPLLQMMGSVDYKNIAFNLNVSTTDVNLGKMDELSAGNLSGKLDNYGLKRKDAAFTILCKRNCNFLPFSLLEGLDIGLGYKYGKTNFQNTTVRNPATSELPDGWLVSKEQLVTEGIFISAGYSLKIFSNSVLKLSVAGTRLNGELQQVVSPKAPEPIPLGTLKTTAFAGEISLSVPINRFLTAGASVNAYSYKTPIPQLLNRSLDERLLAGKLSLIGTFY